jgi:hypothetical protein
MPLTEKGGDAKEGGLGGNCGGGGRHLTKRQGERAASPGGGSLRVAGSRQPGVGPGCRECRSWGNRDTEAARRGAESCRLAVSCARFTGHGGEGVSPGSRSAAPSRGGSFHGRRFRPPGGPGRAGMPPGEAVGSVAKGQPGRLPGEGGCTPHPAGKAGREAAAWHELHPLHRLR